MHGRQPPGTRSVPRPDQTSSEEEPAPASPVSLTAHQVARWADMIAEGRANFPTDLTAPEQDHLLIEVRSRSRHRLVHHLARAIAASMRRDTGPRSETDSHAGP